MWAFVQVNCHLAVKGEAEEILCGRECIFHNRVVHSMILDVKNPTRTHASYTLAATRLHHFSRNGSVTGRPGSTLRQFQRESFARQIRSSWDGYETTTPETYIISYFIILGNNSSKLSKHVNRIQTWSLWQDNFRWVLGNFSSTASWNCKISILDGILVISWHHDGILVIFPKIKYVALRSLELKFVFALIL